MSDFKTPLGSRLRPLQALVHDAVDATTFLVDEGHESTARTIMRAVSLVAPSLHGPVALVDGVRRLHTRGVLWTVRRVNRSVQSVTDVAVEWAGHEGGAPPVVTMHGDRFTSVEGATDQLVGVLNGFVGDHLADSRNGLDLGMRVRHGDRWLDPDRLDEVPEPSSRIVVLVHGLATTELSWCLGSEQALGDPSAHFGGLLGDDLGYSPLYVRYNSGRAVGDNGQALSSVVQALVEGWPAPVDEIVLLGHSMGGLVARSATRAATESGHAWVERLTHVICLGSPHQGAPLARLGESATVLLDRVDHPATRVIARILGRRSTGVKDLRHRALDATGPLLDGVTYLFVAGTVAGRRHHPVAAWFGDALVPVQSASGPQGPRVMVRHVGGVTHPLLQTHPEAFAAIREVLASGSPRAQRDG